jgi:hypothetical protein
MAQRGRPAKAKALEGDLIKAWDGKTLKAKASRGLELASIRAVDRITRLIDSENEQVALAASREVLARNFGLPKATVDVAVTDTSAAHHAALKAIYDKALARLDAKASPIDPNAIDAQVVVDAPAQLESDSATVQIERDENEG